ncbi:MAG: hypothetical protein JNM93_07455 [Bacteriovoracaceae bacterium]|nr:hypothetical protein [Bacteriovoracaceae bacterium]
MNKTAWIVLLLLSTMSTGFAKNVGRAPAVEAFVEIPRQAVEKNKELGIKASYQFMSASTVAAPVVKSVKTSHMSFSVLVSLLIVLCAPFATWNFFMKKLEDQEQAEKSQHEEILAQYQNVKPLFGDNKNNKKTQKTTEEKYKKAA